MVTQLSLTESFPVQIRAFHQRKLKCQIRRCNSLLLFLFLYSLIYVMIKKGDKFRCIKTLIYAHSDLWYQKGKIYISDQDGCITDEDGDIYHEWMGRRGEDVGVFYPLYFK